MLNIMKSVQQEKENGSLWLMNLLQLSSNERYVKDYWDYNKLKIFELCLVHVSTEIEWTVEQTRKWQKILVFHIEDAALKCNLALQRNTKDRHSLKLFTSIIDEQSSPSMMQINGQALRGIGLKPQLYNCDGSANSILSFLGAWHKLG